MNLNVPPRLSSGLLRDCHRMDPWRHGVRWISFVGLYGVGAGAAIFLAEHATGGWTWLVAIPCYLLAAASLHGISLFAHEAVHGTLMQNRFANDVLGALCAIPVLQNCSAYRVLHLRHHQHLGQEGDPDHYANYTRWTWMIFSLNWLRLLVGYPVYIVAIPMLGFKHGALRDRVGILTELLATAGVVGLLMAARVPTVWWVHGWLIPMLFINTMVNIRGMSQHTLLEHVTDEIRGTRTILTVPLVRFFMCNENYHLEHHLYPGVPWHHLSELHGALEAELKRRGAPYIPSYGSFVRDFIRHSVGRSPWGRRSGVPKT